MSYFLLIDLLRSIQHSQPTSFSTALFLRPKQHQKSNATMVPPTARFIDEHSEDPLVAILSVLADTHLVTIVFDPLTTQPPFAQESLPRPAAWMMNAPFNAGHEIVKLRRKLLADLSEWKKDHFNSAPMALLLLYHLCHLHSLVPTFQSLFTLSGYAKSSFSVSGMQREERRASKAFPEYCSAVSTAWQALETSESMALEELPIWAPLSVFSAGLVIWAHKQFTDDEYVDSRSGRSLNPFQKELARMKFSGARDMSNILANLGQRSLRQVGMN